VSSLHLQSVSIDVELIHYEAVMPLCILTLMRKFCITGEDAKNRK
jgi:hypothetical protein